jgi:glycine cleavage system H protein
MLRYLTKTNLLSYNLLRNFSKLYTKQHEWVQIDNDIATIGISDYAQNELGEIVHCELPKIGDKFKQGDTLVIISNLGSFRKR